MQLRTPKLQGWCADSVEVAARVILPPLETTEGTSGAEKGRSLMWYKLWGMHRVNCPTGIPSGYSETAVAAIVRELGSTMPKVGMNWKAKSSTAISSSERTPLEFV